MLGSLGGGFALAQSASEQRQAKPASQVLWFVVLCLFLGYTGYQIYLCYLSYTNPEWSTTVVATSELSFPAVLVCPMFSTNASLEDMFCKQIDTTSASMQNCSSLTVKSNSTGLRDIECALFNADGTVATAEDGKYSSMRIGLTAPTLAIGSELPFSVILFSPDDEHIAVRTLSFVVAPGTSYYVVLSQEEEDYLDGSVSTYFWPSVSSLSSAVINRDQIKILFTYSSFEITTNTEIIAFDWLTLLATLSGTAAFAVTLHQLLLLIFEKCCFCKGDDEDDKEKGDKDSEDEEQRDKEGEGENSKTKKKAAKLQTKMQKAWASVTRKKQQDQDELVHYVPLLKEENI